MPLLYEKVVFWGSTEQDVINYYGGQVLYYIPMNSLACYRNFISENPVIALPTHILSNTMWSKWTDKIQEFSKNTVYLLRLIVVTILNYHMIGKPYIQLLVI